MLYHYHVTYDIECLLSKNGLPESRDKVAYINRHELLSVSICSNKPGYERLVYLIRSGSAQELVDELVDKL